MRVGQEQNRRYFAVCGLSLFFLLVGFYLLTYQGFPLSIDELFIYDMTESFARRGDFYRTYEFSKFNPSVLSGIPWGNPNEEPLMSIMAAPFFSMACWAVRPVVCTPR